MILYIERDSLKSKSFIIDYNPEIAREIINRFRKLHISLKNGDIPEPEAKDDPKINWMCRYCDYREECEMDVSVSSLPVK